MIGNDTRFVVEEDDVQAHGPIAFECIRAHYARLMTLSGALPNRDYINGRIAQEVELFGVLSDGDVQYEPSLLDNENFRLTTIFHLCISMWLEQDIEWESYVTYLELLENAVTSTEENRPEPITPQSILLNLFGVSPQSLPKGFLRQSRAFDEVNMANSMIAELANGIRPADDGFVNYNSYFEYMKAEAVRISAALAEKDMYGAHDTERFALVLISMVNGLPAFDLPYTSPVIQRPVVEAGSIKVMQRQMLSMARGLDPGEEFNDGGE